MIEYKQAKSGKWYFTITAQNGKQLVSSQKTYESRRNARIGYTALIKLITEEEIKEKFKNHKRFA